MHRNEYIQRNMTALTIGKLLDQRDELQRQMAAMQAEMQAVAKQHSIAVEELTAVRKENRELWGRIGDALTENTLMRNERTHLVDELERLQMAQHTHTPIGVCVKFEVPEGSKVGDTVYNVNADSAALAMVKGDRDSLSRELEHAREEIAPMKTPNPVFQDISEERKAQNAQWGGEDFDDQNSTHDWQRYIMKQMSMMNSLFHTSGIRSRWVKIAALAVAAIEAIDRAQVRRE